MITYQIWDKNNHIADIYYDNKVYRAKILDRQALLPVLFGFPDNGSTENPQSIHIENFLKLRVIPQNRDYLKEILAQNNMYEYDWKELIKLNKGMTTDDPYRIEVIEE